MLQVFYFSNTIYFFSSSSQRFSKTFSAKHSVDQPSADTYMSPMFLRAFNKRPYLPSHCLSMFVKVGNLESASFHYMCPPSISTPTHRLKASCLPFLYPFSHHPLKISPKPNTHKHSRAHHTLEPSCACHTLKTSPTPHTLKPSP